MRPVRQAVSGRRDPHRAPGHNRPGKVHHLYALRSGLSEKGAVTARPHAAGLENDAERESGRIQKTTNLPLNHRSKMRKARAVEFDSTGLFVTACSEFCRTSAVSPAQTAAPPA